MRKAGIFLLVLGLAGTLVFGIRALQKTDSLDVFGVQIAVSSANWLPVIFSALVLLIGIVLLLVRKKG